MTLRGGHNHLNVGRELFDGLQQGNPVHAGEIDVGHDDLRRPVMAHRESGLTTRGRHHMIALFSQESGRRFAESLISVYQQNLPGTLTERCHFNVLALTNKAPI
jgi:hypothetical protein